MTPSETVRRAARRIVLIGPAPPDGRAPDAGTRYVTALTEVLARHDDVAVLSADYGRQPLKTEVHGRVTSAVIAPASPLLRRFLRRTHLALARLDPALPYLPFVAALVSAPWRQLVATADVIDLHYSDSARLAGLVRWLNPDAVLIATHHDVVSQRFSRLAARPARLRSRLRWRLARRLAARAEARSLQRTDTAVVFSEKDARLLSAGAATTASSVRVVLPPFPSPTGVRTRLVERQQVALVVAFLACPENDEAVRWLVEKIWPVVIERVPAARLVVAGAGASEGLTSLLRQRTTVEHAGYVDDLDSVYGRARVCVVPLRHGAGVKFKTVEAMVAGVPVVTTSVGLEGIGGAERAACVADDARALAEGLVRALLSPDQASADEVRGWAGRRYGPAGFEQAVREVYGSASQREHQDG